MQGYIQKLEGIIDIKDREIRKLAASDEEQRRANINLSGIIQKQAEKIHELQKELYDGREIGSENKNPFENSSSKDNPITLTINPPETIFSRNNACQQ